MRRSCVVALAGILLGGCATTHIRPNVNPAVALARWHDQKRMVSRISQFALDAQIGASGSFGTSGSLRWVQKGQSFYFHFAGPFDTDAITINGTPTETTIHSASRTIRTSNPEAYLRQHLRWTLPIAGLRYWALGLPIPATSSSLRYSDTGTLRYLRQDGWTIRYQSYREVAGYVLPAQLRARTKDTEVRIDIYRWTAIKPPAPRR